MSGEVVVESTTGEIVPIGSRLTPEQAAARTAWVREVTRAALTAGVDYGQLPGVDRPTLFKPGAELLLLAAGLGFTMDKVDDRDARDHEGVTYKATVQRADGSTVSQCDGFAGYDESRFYKPQAGNRAEYRAPWNTLVKMAQKRALVGAALNATAASGLFVADVEDTTDTESARTRKERKRAGAKPTRRSEQHPEDLYDDPDVGRLAARLTEAPDAVRSAFREWRKEQRLDWPPPDPQTTSAMARELDDLFDRADELGRETT